jgi:hypothetical protein
MEMNKFPTTNDTVGDNVPRVAFNTISTILDAMVNANAEMICTGKNIGPVVERIVQYAQSYVDSLTAIQSGTGLENDLLAEKKKKAFAEYQIRVRHIVEEYHALGEDTDCFQEQFDNYVNRINRIKIAINDIVTIENIITNMLPKQ